MTLIANLFAGPGAGKSTIAAGVFHEMKKDHRNVEYVGEFAKDLTWESRTTALGFQPYVIGKQMYRIWRLLGKVDVVITDSPILLGWHYAPHDTPPGFFDMVLEYHQRWDSVNILLKREDRPYNPAGRNQSRVEAVTIDLALQQILEQTNTPHIPLKVSEDTVGAICRVIYERMGYENSSD